MSNIIDTRDLAKRLEELQDLSSTLEDCQCSLDEARKALEEFKITHPELEGNEGLADELAKLESEIEDAENALSNAEGDFGDDEREELTELENVESEISGFYHGETLIPESDFEDYCRELLTDCGDIPRSFPDYIEINWEKTANNIRQDYSSIDYQGETYFYRN